MNEKKKFNGFLVFGLLNFLILLVFITGIVLFYINRKSLFKFALSETMTYLKDNKDEIEKVFDKNIDSLISSSINSPTFKNNLNNTIEDVMSNDKVQQSIENSVENILNSDKFKNTISNTISSPSTQTAIGQTVDETINNNTLIKKIDQDLSTFSPGSSGELF